ncbi:hypothetical protein HYN48_07135 [Flavobacterium magnum]|uniref:Cytochrome c domain-containing protein n=1 Tax=Flavobacterium magnum TaxID=2162713 RepID=A0A2S0RJV7_9FLAO|nr:hypothetical protein [Flavobacterium magnum]AWA31431.1 hypothetical protein HYN48_07135 [Flavobacterium magnum]
MHLKTLLKITFTGILISACSNDSPDDLIKAQPGTETVTYVANVKPIITNNCLSCHTSPPVNGAPMQLTTYEDVRNAVLNRGLLNRISRQNGEQGLMPNGGPRMPQHNIDVINQWVEDGLVEQ